MGSEGCSNKLFLGTFVHSKSREELDYLHSTAVFVDSTGIIAAVEQDCDLTRAREHVFPRLGWAGEEVEIVTGKPGQFFFPGFIGMAHIHTPRETL